MLMSRVTRGVVLAAISFSSFACDRAVDDRVTHTAAALRMGAAALGGGHARVLVDDIPAAENLLFTSDGRLLVSSDDGLYEIVREGAAYRKAVVRDGQSCQFGGLVEVDQVIYANCYDFTDSTLFAAPLTAALDFRTIHSLPGYSLANGLTADDDGNLYIGATFQGSILRLRPSAADPLTIANQDVFVDSPGVFTDGIKFWSGALYWTNFTEIDTAPITNNHAGPMQNLVAAFTFFDDLYVDDAGILVADAINGTVRSYSPQGLFDGVTSDGTFDGPSAVLPAAGRLGLSESALVVTERGGGKVSVLEP